MAARLMSHILIDQIENLPWCAIAR